MYRIVTMVCLVLCASSAQAGFLGKSLEASYQFPDIDTEYPFGTFSPATFVVTGGLATTGNIEGVTFLPVEFTDDTLTITLETVLTAPTWNAASFNGVLLTLLSPGDFEIESFSVNPATTLGGFNDSRVLVTGTSIGINWQGLSYVDGKKVVVNFAFKSQPIPEPSTLALAGVGVLGLGAGCWRTRSRRRKAESANV